MNIAISIFGFIGMVTLGLVFEHTIEQLRERRRIICREAAWLLAAMWIGEVAGYGYFGAVLFNAPLTNVGYWLGVALGWFGFDLAVWTVTRRSFTGFMANYNNIRIHRKHEEDCKYGPKRTRSAVKRQLRWQKVAIRPAFGAT